MFAASRAVARPLRRIARRPLASVRWDSSSSSSQPRQQPPEKQPSPTGQFYSTFARPLAKCLLTAVFTYQVVYWTWLRLETNEVKAERQAEITKLEAQVRSLQGTEMKK